MALRIQQLNEVNSLSSDFVIAAEINGDLASDTKKATLATLTDYIHDNVGIEGIPSGGSTSQVLGKDSNSDYDVSWQTPHYIPSGGLVGEIIMKQSGDDYDVDWVASPTGIPSGGTTGQVLEKSSNSDYDVEWSTPTATASINFLTVQVFS